MFLCFYVSILLFILLLFYVSTQKYFYIFIQKYFYAFAHLNIYIFA